MRTTFVMAAIIVLVASLALPTAGFAWSVPGKSVVAQAQKPTPAAHTQKPAAPAKPDLGMTNEAVIKMVKSGLSEDLIIGAIKGATKKSFDLSADGLIALKTAGVSDKIMMIMSGIEPPPPPVTAPTPAPKIEPTVPTREPGFYISVTGKETPLDPSVITGGKVGTKRMMLTGGFGKAKMKAIVKGERASIRVSMPTDLIFVAGNGLSHPNEISIVKFGIEDKSRVFQVGETGAFSGVRSGIRDEDSMPYKAEKIGPGTFKLVLDKPLPPGEYALMSAAMVQVSLAGTSGKLWDFGVDR